jgi:hypothetical protein
VSSMEPIPETVRALDELDPVDESDRLLAGLTRLANRAREVVPDLVGVSVARLERGVTFTLVASAEDVAVLDAIQYAAGGPCVDGALEARVQEFHDDDALDERSWRLFAETTAARAVRSTLTLPVMEEDRAVGSVNLYAASGRAFEGHHDQLADVFGAWAGGAVTNADLSFATRRTAQEAPEVIRDQVVVDVAGGILAMELGLEVEDALARLHDSARRAGVSAVEVARVVVETRGEPD